MYVYNFGCSACQSALFSMSKCTVQLVKVHCDVLAYICTVPLSRYAYECRIEEKLEVDMSKLDIEEEQAHPHACRYVESCGSHVIVT